MNPARESDPAVTLLWGTAQVRPVRVAGAGFTLLEMMLVLGLVALLSTSVVAGFRSFSKAELRSSSAKLAGMIRYLFDRASTTGKIHRLVFDFDNGKYWAEVSDDRFFMPRERETDETREKEIEDIAQEKKDEEEAAKALESMGDEALADPSRYQPTEWKPKRARFEPVSEKMLKPIELHKVKLAGLFTPRYARPITTGQGYLYFFPLGQTEPSIVHVSDEEGKSFFSLLVHPLSGKVKVHGGYVEPRIDEQFDDEGNAVTVPQQ
jgi:prepilin-type N-terminal cleavage/methylation domain-containing protein